MSQPSNRNTPVEHWPESVNILCLLIDKNEPLSMVTIARELEEPEITTRNRLLKLEVAGAVKAFKRPSAPLPGGRPERRSTHYVVAQYGRDCAVKSDPTGKRTSLPCANSVFALAAAMGLTALSDGSATEH